MSHCFLPDDEATERLGAELAALTPPGATWLLRGELGAGKTTWTRGFVAGLGGNPEQVASPTYAVLHRYEIPDGRIFHLDLYRLGPNGVWSLGLEEIIEPQDRLVVEWAGEESPLGGWTGRLRLIQSGEGREAIWEFKGPE